MSWVRWEHILASKNNGGLRVAIHGKDADIANNTYSSQGIWANIVNLSNVLHEKDRITGNTFSWQCRRPVKNERNGTSFTELLSELHSLTLTSTPDTCQWLLSKDDMFSVSDTRKHIHAIILPINNYDSIWSNLLLIKGLEVGVSKDWIWHIGDFLEHGYAISSLMDTTYWSSE
ncbi:hypothetical protein Tco_1024769 [Tanacetum coccineum]